MTLPKIIDCISHTIYINLLSCRHSDLTASAPMITSAVTGHEQPITALKYIGHLFPLLFALWEL